MQLKETRRRMYLVLVLSAQRLVHRDGTRTRRDARGDWAGKREEAGR